MQFASSFPRGGTTPCPKAPLLEDISTSIAKEALQHKCVNQTFNTKVIVHKTHMYIPKFYHAQQKGQDSYQAKVCQKQGKSTAKIAWEIRTPRMRLSHDLKALKTKVKLP